MPDFLLILSRLLTSKFFVKVTLQFSYCYVKKGGLKDHLFIIDIPTNHRK